MKIMIHHLNLTKISSLSANISPYESMNVDDDYPYGKYILSNNNVHSSDNITSTPGNDNTILITSYVSSSNTSSSYERHLKQFAPNFNGSPVIVVEQIDSSSSSGNNIKPNGRNKIKIVFD